MHSLIAIAALCLMPGPELPTDVVPILEDNTVLYEDGTERFRQVIPWDWADVGGYQRHHVRDWRFIKSPHHAPRWSTTCRQYEMIMPDTDCYRRIRAPFLLRTFTLHDREVQERPCLPPARRRKLFSGVTQ